MKKPRLSSWLAFARAQGAKWKVPCLILVLGLALLLLPGGRDAAKAQTQTEEEPAMTAQTAQMETQLRALLSQVDGVGRVELMLTVEESGEQVYQTDLRRTESGQEQTTIFETGQSAQKTPVVSKTRAAQYRGAVVVCDGAERAQVRLRVVQAVSALTGLGSDQISVIKMKGQQEDGT